MKKIFQISWFFGILSVALFIIMFVPEQFVLGFAFLSATIGMWLGYVCGYYETEYSGK